MARVAVSRTGVFLALLFCLASCGEEPVRFDLLIVNGIVVDGTGTPGFAADVGIIGGAIERVGPSSEQERAAAGRLIDAQGLAVSPGFIDIHSHSEWSLLYDGTAQSKIRQGVTTEILGESLSAGPFKGRAARNASYGIPVDWERLGEYYSRLESSGISLNVGSFVGATQVRLCVLGEESRDPTPAELEEMKALVSEAMEDGAFGLATALLVPPNTYHTTEQLAEMASAVRPFGGIYSTHIRTEGEGIEEAIREAIEIGEKAGVPVDVIHLKIADRRMCGTMREVCELFEAARAGGLQVTANQYPYIAGQNNLDALIPPWAMEGGREEMMQRLQDPSARARMEQDINRGLPGWFNHYQAIDGWEGCQIASVRSEKNKAFAGKSIAEVASMTSKKPTDVVFDLLLDEQGSVPAVYFLMCEEDVREAMTRPWVSFGSDGTAVRPEGVLGEGNPHPRWYGTFPRILGRYVREQGVLSLEEAVRKMTSANAQKLGIQDRGLLKAGFKADVTVFDSETIADRATFSEPHQYPVGVEYVVVNGIVVLAQGEHAGTKPGQILRNPVASGLRPASPAQ